MTPLDLTTHRPRSVRAQLAGIAYLPRAIDKVRAELPGGRLGSYIILTDGVRTLSAGMYHVLGFTHDEFLAVVAEAEDENEVAAWVLGRVGDEAVAKWNQGLLTRRIGDITGVTRERMLAVQPGAAAMPPDTLLVDMFDADDDALYAPGGDE